MKSGKDVSVSDAVKNWNIVSIITASWRYYCPKCGFARPKPDFDAEDVKVGDQLSFCVEGKHIVANYKGFYNVYNILAAYAGVRTAGFAGEHFGDMLRRFNPETDVWSSFALREQE